MNAATSGPSTLGINEAGAATFSGNVTILGSATLTAAASGTATFSGILSGAGSVTKAGLGTVTLTGANTYSGGTTISAGKLIIGNIGSLGSGNLAVSGGVLDLNNLAPTNVILVSGGSLLNASAWAALGAVQLSGNVGSDQINNLGDDITEVKVAAGATVNLAGVTKDIVFEGGTLTNLTTIRKSVARLNEIEKKLKSLRHVKVLNIEFNLFNQLF
jgi:autotransporter-associated beta strand protein